MYHQTDHHDIHWISVGYVTIVQLLDQLFRFQEKIQLAVEFLQNTYVIHKYHQQIYIIRIYRKIQMRI